MPKQTRPNKTECSETDAYAWFTKGTDRLCSVDQMKDRMLSSLNYPYKISKTGLHDLFDAFQHPEGGGIDREAFDELFGNKTVREIYEDPISETLPLWQFILNYLNSLEKRSSRTITVEQLTLFCNNRLRLPSQISKEQASRWFSEQPTADLTKLGHQDLVKVLLP